MSEVFETLLLVALPASGKSEVRKFLETKDPSEFHIGPTVQLDDYPYVHFQILIDEALAEMGRERLFHTHFGGPFIHGWDWGGLIQLLNEDFEDVKKGNREIPQQAARALFQRIDRACVKAGGEERLSKLPADVIDKLAEKLEGEAQKIYREKVAQVPDSLDGKTVVIEFARGGREGATFPLPEHYGYAGSFRQLSPEILESAAALYIWVTPEESRRKNRERAKPGAQDSILFHGTPEEVMRIEYGCDDIEYLLKNSEKPGTVTVTTPQGEKFHLPLERFDNREDKTSFLRNPPETWSEEDVQKLYTSLKSAFDKLWENYKSLKK